MTRERRVAEVLIALADTLTATFDMEDLLNSLAIACVELLDVDAVGIMLSDHRGGLTLTASSSADDGLQQLFEVQARADTCLQCFETGRPVLNVGVHDDSGDESESPLLASPTRMKVAHALPLRLRHEVVGAISMVSRSPAPLASEDVALGQALADMATISFMHDRGNTAQNLLAGQLQAALDSRELIAQATGMLAGLANIATDEAHDRLRKHARAHNNRLTATAQSVLDGILDLTTASASEAPGSASGSARARPRSSPET